MTQAQSSQKVSYSLGDLSKVTKQTAMSSNMRGFKIQPKHVRKAARRKEERMLKAMRLW